MKNIVILNLLLLLIISSCVFAPGSYPYVEKYEIRLNEEDIITKIEEFKKKHPEYDMSEHLDYPNGRRNEKAF